MRFHMTKVSLNRKTGPIPTSTVSKDTCPASCKLREAGCYAEGGPLAIHWRRVEKEGMDLSEFLKEVRKLPKKQLWRYGQAGDLPPLENDLLELAKANQNRPVLVYTHGRDFDAYRKANELGFHINLSADSVEEADELAETGLSVVVVLPSDTGKRKQETVSEYRNRLGGTLKVTTPGGRTIVPCPATYMEDVTCLSCQLCKGVRKNDVIIGFPAHGYRKTTVNERLANVQFTRSGASRTTSDGIAPQPQA